MKTTSIGIAGFACTFCDVERDGQGRPSKLIGQLALSLRQRSNHLEGEYRKLKRTLIDVEPLVIQHARCIDQPSSKGALFERRGDRENQNG